MDSRTFRKWMKGGGWQQHLVIFVVCLLWDGMLTFDTIFTAHFNIGQVGITSYLNVWLGYMLFDAVVEDSIISYSKAQAAALGASAGGMIGTAILRVMY